MTTRPYRPRADALHIRAKLLDLHRARTQADPRWTVSELASECCVAEITVKRHLAWLRSFGLLAK